MTNGKHSDWKADQKRLRAEEIAARKATRIKWQRRKADAVTLPTVPVRTEFREFDPTPKVIPPK